MSKDLTLTGNEGLPLTAISAATGGNSTDDGIDIRLRRRAKNKLKKEESKRVREEELRRRLYEPKDQRIRLVKPCELEKILNPTQVVNSTSSQNAPNISLNDFPSLGKSKTHGTSKTKEKQHMPSSSQEVIMGNWPSSPYSEPECSKSIIAQENATDAIKQSVSSTTPGYIPFRKPKRNAPIKIEVLTALKKSKSVANVPVNKQKVKKDLPPQLSGNQLDSSNPTRNKGKKREVPKDKKPSSLKLVILHDREVKRSIGNASCSAFKDDVGSTDRLCPELSAEAVSPDSTESPVDPSPESSEDTFLLEKSSGITSTNNKEDESSNKILSLDNIHIKENDCDFDTITSEKLKIHSRKFREYCNHDLSPELDSLVTALIKDIVKFQDRLYFNDPVKAHAKRRFVLGFRESKKYLDLKKIKLLIIAPDLERVQSAGGIDDTVEELKAASAAQDVPCVFALGRKVLKKLTNKSFKISGISCMGILNYEGTQDNFHAIVDLLPKLHAQYQDKLQSCDSHLQTQSEEKSEDGLTDEVLSVVENEKAVTDVNSEVVASFLQKLSEGICKI